jgi:hypothetical protein
LVFQHFPWYCSKINKEKYTEDKIADFEKELNINTDNVIAFDAKNVVYLFLTHDINNKRTELNKTW